MTVLLLMNPILWSQNLILGAKMLLRNQIWTLLLHYTARLPNRWSRDKLDLIRITQDTRPSQYHLLLCQEISTIPISLLYSSAIGRNPLVVKAHMISGSLPSLSSAFSVSPLSSGQQSVASNISNMDTEASLAKTGRSAVAEDIRRKQEEKCERRNTCQL